MKLLPLRPSVKNPRFWYPDRPNKTKWNRIREKMLLRDHHTCRFCGHRASKYMQAHHVGKGTNNSVRNLLTCCVACHAVLHFGRNLLLETIEIWESPFSQLEIVRKTRAGIKAGKTLRQIKKGLKLKKGLYHPASLRYADELIRQNLQTKSSAHNFALDKPFSAVFVNFKRWQVDEGSQLKTKSKQKQHIAKKRNKSVRPKRSIRVLRQKSKTKRSAPLTK